MRKIAGWFRSLTNRGIRFATVVTWIAALVSMTGAVYFAFSTAFSPFSVKFEPIGDDQVREFSSPISAEEFDHVPIEKQMIDSVAGGEVPGFPSFDEAMENLSGYPVLYAYVAAPIYQWYGYRGLALFNVLCTLIAMIVIWKIGARMWRLREELETITELAEGDLGAIRETVKGGGDKDQAAPERQQKSESPETKSEDPAAPQDSAEAPPEREGTTANDGPDARAMARQKKREEKAAMWSQTPVTIGLFGLLVMGAYAFNPIVFNEAIQPSARPFAYLLSLLAFLVSMRVLDDRRFPKLLVTVLVIASGFVHLPAVLIIVPILLLVISGGSIKKLQKFSFVRKMRSSRRRILFAIVIAVVGSFAGTFFANLQATQGAVAEFLDGFFPGWVSATINSWLDYSKQVFSQLGEMAVKYAPQIAVLSLIPIKSVQDGILERVMLLYAVGLFAFFTILFPSSGSTQLYPIMFPIAVLGAVGIVSTIVKYLRIDNIFPELVRFFGTLSLAPVVGTALIWISTEPLNKANEVTNKLFGKENLVTPTTVAITVIALIGLIWLIKKRSRSAPAHLPESGSADR